MPTMLKTCKTQVFVKMLFVGFATFNHKTSPTSPEPPTYDFADDALILNMVWERQDNEKRSRHFNLLMLQLQCKNI